jgi:hypothetical protein
MRKWTIMRLVTACVAAIAVGSFAAVPAANAAASTMACTWYGCYNSDSPLFTGYGHWFPDGDAMYVCDSSADGWSVVVIARFGAGDYRHKWHTAGAGKCTERSYGNLPEGTGFSFWTCIGDYSDDRHIFGDSCGSEKFVRA